MVVLVEFRGLAYDSARPLKWGEKAWEDEMAQVKGKFITMAYALLQTKPEAKIAAFEAVKRMTGKQPQDLDPEGWYDTAVFQAIFQATYDHVPALMAWAAIKVMGQRVYPTIKATVGLPEFSSPVEALKFEAQGFLANHRGLDVKPRNILKAEAREAIIDALSPGYSCALIEGVFDGILKMSGVHNAQVKQVKCVNNGDDTCVFHIKW